MTTVHRASHSPVEGAKPFLKWAGGKRRLLSQYAGYFPPPSTIGRYYEPFIGSAAIFFHLQPAEARLADVNQNLVEVYRVVQQDVERVICSLKGHKNERDYYYRVRDQDPAELTPAHRAARLIYLNRTCYNGLYRENQKGRFNVPFGRYDNPTICDEDRLRRASQALQGVELVDDDFEVVVAPAGLGDFVYFDPPYVPLSNTSNFTAYNRYGFDLDDQRRLAEVIGRLTRQGCRVMLSNSSAPLVYELYDRPEYRLVPIQARRSINSKAGGRGPVKELLILNYGLGT
ncbi:MAG TPA: DNA adenine methylase [Anaerolineae bacterium]|jgi:DNA adenine methylase|nr:DNA adenine methylase [Anaerolineae bacterium]